MNSMMNGEKAHKKNNTIAAILSSYYDDFTHKPYMLFRLILMLVAILLVSLSWYLFDRHENFGVGRPASRTYFALISQRYEDRAATLELRQRAAARIADVMVRNEKISSEVEAKLDLLQEGKFREILSPQLIDLLGKLSSASQKRITVVVKDISTEIKDRSENRDQQSSAIWRRLRSSKLSQSEQNVAFQVLDHLLSPTLQTDSELASRLRDDVATQISPVVREVHTGSVLVQKGQTVTPSIAKLLKSQGYPDSTFPIKKLIFLLLIIGMWSAWPMWIESGLKNKLSYYEWIYIAVVLSLSWTLEVGFSRFSSVSMAVLGMTGWLCLTLPVSLSYHIIFGGAIVGSMIAFGTTPVAVAVAAILASFSASIGRIIFLNPPNHRFTIWRNLFLLGAFLGGVTVVIYWGLDIHFTYTLPLSAILLSAVWGTIVVALLPFWEYMFDVISPLRLLELSHPSQPILKRLQLEAPGTYHHTLMVGTLAEAAADKLKMNGLLVKAGAYYHDIGKLKNPSFFVENQLAGDNIHDELSPSLSALVIISHVKEGLEIAEDIRLPKTLRRFIAEHHGTTIQKYFYEKAKALDSSLSEEQFRYPGVSPQSKETALVMFADSVEAAVKARGKPFESIRELHILVNNVIKSKIDAEQLTRVDFTFAEISIIKDCFVDVLRSMYHSREVKELELPKNAKPEQELERVKRENLLQVRKSEKNAGKAKNEKNDAPAEIVEEAGNSDMEQAGHSEMKQEGRK